MVKQYPYSLYNLTKPESVFNPQTGMYEVGEGTWEFVSICRDESNAQGKSITVDGEVYIYGALIYLPRGVYPIKNGDNIQVRDEGDNVRIDTNIKGFVFNQLNSKVWV